MKTIKIFGTFVLAALIAACTPEPISVEDVTADSEELQATHTIKEFLDTYLTETGTYFPVRTRSGQEALFSVDDIPMDGEDIIIRVSLPMTMPATSTKHSLSRMKKTIHKPCVLV